MGGPGWGGTPDERLRLAGWVVNTEAQACGPGIRYEPKQGRMRIVIDADTADHSSASFYRFTVAEEFAHLLLHRDILTQIRTAQDLIALHTWSGDKELPLRIIHK